MYCLMPEHATLLTASRSIRYNSVTCNWDEFFRCISLILVVIKVSMEVDEGRQLTSGESNEKKE